ncbi:CpaF family protein [Nocardiopsis changdeensis]|uniref:CpaF family protein n=1 Tax=Nocardiopsis changdeensis TaxID=2831969 RepID=A0ABX8BUW2_9ACTN|nr:MULTISPECIES: ATPase, T2SS/T4P/T4SS family [Nocardiopsis]QUX24158.1 CpaF family protein [Nocardiopsis changdeensis]QYX34553.1 Flp pilus assembly complex ATPase component TadA [Nocardiopsis sp. MT53]
MTATNDVPRLAPTFQDGPDEAALRTTAVALAGRITEQLITDHDRAADPESVGRLVDALLEERARTALIRGGVEFTAADEARLRRVVLDHVLGLGPLEELLAEPEVQNIHITGNDPVTVDLGGGHREPRPAVVDTDAALVSLVQRIAARAPGGERRFDTAAPILSMELKDGSRLSAVMPGIAARPTVTIRRHPARYLRLGDLARAGMVDQAARDLLVAAVRARMNLLISGATNAGKTTLLRALAGTVEGERIITVEDALELGLHRHLTDVNVVALQGRPANIEGLGEVTLAELVRAALRMCPDRVIVGETRGPETIALLNAMSMGTDGSMSTVHASSSQQVFAKLAAYCAQAPERMTPSATAALVGAAVHLVVHIDVAPDGDRVVTSVRQVVGSQGEQVVSDELYTREADEPTGEMVCPPSGQVGRHLARVGYPMRRWA